MKVVKTLLAFIFTLILAFVLVAGSINFSFQRNVLEGDKFIESFDRNQLSQIIAEDIINTLSKSNPTPSKDNMFDSSFMADMLYSLDRNYLSDQIGVIVKSTYSYVMGESKALPTIDIKPVKSVFLDALSKRIISEESAMQNIGELRNLVVSAREEFNISNATELYSKAIESASYRVRLDRINATAEDFVDAFELIVSSPQKNDREFALIFVQRTLRSTLNWASVADELDLERIMKSLTTNNSNPLMIIKDMIEYYKISINSLLLFFVGILCLIIITIVFDPRFSLSWITIGFMLAGVFNWMIGAAYFFLNKKTILKPVFGDQTLSSPVADGARDFVGDIFNRFFIEILVYGLILVVVSLIVYIIVSKITNLFKKPTLNIEVSKKTTTFKTGIFIARSLLVIMLVASIYFFWQSSLSVFVDKSSEFQERFDTVMKDDIDIVDILSKELKAPFLVDNTLEKYR